MNKTNLIEKVRELTNSTKDDVEVLVDVVLNSITEALGKGEKVDLRGFGSFQVSEKKQRQGRNPRTGETMTIAARNAVVFKPSKELSGRLNVSVEHSDVAVDETDAQPSEGSTKIHGDKINT